MSTNKHPHEEAILAYYRGETIQSRASDEGLWWDIPTYSPSIAPYPSFDPKLQYRVAPKTYTVELTQGELELLFLLAEHVGGDPQITARKHATSFYYKVLDRIGPRRRDTLRDWSGKQNFRTSGIISELPL